MKKRVVLALFFIVCLGLSCQKEKKQEEKRSNDLTSVAENYLIGTYTDSLSQGINLLSFNPFTQELKLEVVLDSIPNPSFVVTNKAKTIIAAVGEIQGKEGGLLHTFSYDKGKGIFKELTTVATLGNDPCTLAFSPNENALIVGNYSGGNLTAFPVAPTGEIKNYPQVIQHEGNSITKERQEKAHVHCVVFHPTENKLFVADLGNDTIDIIPYTEENNQILLLPEKTISTKMPLGSGPRHLVFNNDGNKIYVVFELTNEIAVLDYTDNKLQLLEVKSLTDKKTNLGSAAEVRINKENDFLYVSVRGEDNQLVAFKINKGASLEKIQSIPTEWSPRNFILSKNEDFILVASQGSNSIVVYTRDKETGLLQHTKNRIEIHKPVYFFEF
ncbi:beta-propeller fold lactonase family protein [Flavobacterium sp. TP390]|uniref:Beta-propeller fold lactonase family protein n=1 Tax=Flavobacterium profundi TaxID=1774945 RepID=A0A6I4IUS8_9FLAO|nr:lactonase family protein [Flavobacterium profundi]MVO10634.1 beta-propeller fold lactonase family protein [Flavobacterium profundi]